MPVFWVPSRPFHLHIHFGIGIFSLPCGAAAVADIERSMASGGASSYPAKVTGVTQRAIEAIYWCHMTGTFARTLPPPLAAFANQCPSAVLVLLLLRVIKSSNIKKRTLNERFLRVSSVDATRCELFCLWGKQAQFSSAQQFTLCVPIKQINKQSVSPEGGQRDNKLATFDLCLGRQSTCGQCENILNYFPESLCSLSI